MTKKPTVESILDSYPQDEASLIEILHDIQSVERHLPRDAIKKVSEHLDIPLSRVVSVATFYTAFSFEPKGEKVIKICMGTACHVKGANLIKEEAERKLGIKAGQTTQDGKYTLEVVNCVGACAMAPLVIENEKYFGKFKPVGLDKLLEAGE